MSRIPTTVVGTVDKLGGAPVAVGQRASRDVARRQPLAQDVDDYGLIPLDVWSELIRKDVDRRFGPIPTYLVPVGEPGW
jgi:hypothetical protein